MIILGIDSSDDFVSVGLAGPSGIVISKSSEPEIRNKNMLHDFTRNVMKTADIEFADLGGVAVAIGPGSFTGLRVGLAVAKGICWSMKLPLVGVSSLMAVARTAVRQEGRVVAVKDAKRKEFYYAGYALSSGATEQTIRDSVAPAIEIADILAKGYTPIGPGLSALRREKLDLPLPADDGYLRDALGGAVAASGRELIISGKRLELASCSPNYIRNPKPIGANS